MLNLERFPNNSNLCRQGLTIRSPIDCCIAQAALDNDLLLIHNDRDLETIAQVRALQHLWLQCSARRLRNLPVSGRCLSQCRNCGKVM